MAQNRRRSRKNSLSVDDRIRYIRLAAIPLIIVAVLVAVFVLMHKKPGTEETFGTPAGYSSAEGEIEIHGDQKPDGGSRAEDQAQSGEDPSGDESVEPDNSEYKTDFSKYELKKDEIPQVNQLISEYFQAKVDQDAETLYRLFGKTDDGSLAARKKELENEGVFIEDYQAITCYTKPGLTADSYVAYVTYEVKFRRVDTLAPGLMWCYIVKNEDGNYIIRENVIGDEADYVASQNQTEDVRLLSTQVNERLRQAIESDSLLAGRYKELLNGAIVSDSEETESGQDSQIELIDDGAGTGQAPAGEVGPGVSGPGGASEAGSSESTEGSGGTQEAGPGVSQDGSEEEPSAAPSQEAAADPQVTIE